MDIINDQSYLEETNINKLKALRDRLYNEVAKRMKALEKEDKIDTKDYSEAYQFYQKSVLTDGEFIRQQELDSIRQQIRLLQHTLKIKGQTGTEVRKELDVAHDKLKKARLNFGNVSNEKAKKYLDIINEIASSIGENEPYTVQREFIINADDHWTKGLSTAEIEAKLTKSLELFERLNPTFKDLEGFIYIVEHMEQIETLLNDPHIQEFTKKYPIQSFETYGYNISTPEDVIKVLKKIKEQGITEFEEKNRHAEDSRYWDSFDI